MADDTLSFELAEAGISPAVDELLHARMGKSLEEWIAWAKTGDGPAPAASALLRARVADACIELTLARRVLDEAREARTARAQALSRTWVVRSLRLLADSIEETRGGAHAAWMRDALAILARAR